MADENYIVIPKWDTFQHYKDRNPSWIKLYPELLNDPDFYELPESTRLLLVSIWMLYAQSRGKVPAKTRYLSNRLSMRVRRSALDSLVEHGWITLVTSRPSSDLNFRDWPSRYIADDVRQSVFERDSRQCVDCSSPDNLEIDHIIPVSRWKEIGFADLDADDQANLRTLCRSCNRRKNRYGSAEHLRSEVARNRVALTRARALAREETETELEEEAETTSEPFLDIQKQHSVVSEGDKQEPSADIEYEWGDPDEHPPHILIPELRDIA